MKGRKCERKWGVSLLLSVHLSLAALLNIVKPPKKKSPFCSSTDLFCLFLSCHGDVQNKRSWKFPRKEWRDPFQTRVDEIERYFGNRGGSFLLNANWHNVCLISVSGRDHAFRIIPELTYQEPSVTVPLAK